MPGSGSESDKSLQFKSFSSFSPTWTGWEFAGLTVNTDKEHPISPDVTGDFTALGAATLITSYDNELHTTPTVFCPIIGQRKMIRL
jgi:hypothetical protein